MELLFGFLIGLVVMDFMWAWKMGIPQAMWYRWKHRNDPKPEPTTWDPFGE